VERQNKIPRTCKNDQALREEKWPLPTTLQEKLYGPVDACRIKHVMFQTIVHKAIVRHNTETIVI
jgi:hypothetical protein